MTSRTDDDGRRLPLTGAFNLRDFGGYETMDGRTVRRGMLFRSGTMTLLSKEDAAHLRSIGIRSICDFRRESERQLEPTLWHDEDVDYYCRDYMETSGMLGEMLREDRSTPEDMRQAMERLYRTLHIDHAESYRAMFQLLLKGRVPIVINCAAGKDRTGVGAALILTALGVGRDNIVQDYLLTNSHADWDWLLSQVRISQGHGVKASAEVINALKAADAAYLHALYDQLDIDHGGIDAYLADVLGIDAAARAELRTLLLEP
ncbi:MAG TPA: tyrosine-protein phosphatase [Sphingobium sp.]|nr:tyrosine-protein phosphatase [Sphingobium sp.]